VFVFGVRRSVYPYLKNREQVMQAVIPELQPLDWRQAAIDPNLS
jgi:hypothetical protein